MTERAICEGCSVCGKQFEVQLRWQMEERDGGFSFFCSRPCYETSAVGDGAATCDACSKRFSVELVSQVFALKHEGRTERRYACSLPCREQLVRESEGTRLGDLRTEPVAVPAPEPRGTRITPVQAPAQPLAAAPPRTTQARPPTSTDQVPRRIAVFNHKGGTGKTTTAVSVAAALAARGKRVLLVDTDAQGNVAASLGLRTDKSLYHVVVMGLSPAEAAQPVRANLDVLGSNETLAAAELYLAGRRERDRVLRDRLASTSQLYDVVILDCSPSLSLMNQNALVFADSLLVPVACDYLSLVGVRQVLKTVKNVNQLLHHPVRIGGVIPTMYDARAKICQDALSTLREHFGDRCLRPIRATAKIKEAPAHQKTIFEWAEGSNAARDYDDVVDQLWSGIGAVRVDDDSTRLSNDEAVA
jgi:chromosome partitioning protein